LPSQKKLVKMLFPLFDYYDFSHATMHGWLQAGMDQKCDGLGPIPARPRGADLVNYVFFLEGQLYIKREVDKSCNF
jgi:hypothetical protein